MATERIQEFCDNRGVKPEVDRAAGVVRGVKLLGLVSKNGREYLPEAVASAVALYEGAKVNVNHGKRGSGPRDYQDRFGSARNVSVRPNEGLFGDFHFNPKHALAEQFCWDAEHAPENVGFSHDADARTSQRNGKTIVEAILAVESVDLVANPATTKGLFEAMNDPLETPGGSGGDMTADMFSQKATEIFKGDGDPATKARKIAKLVKALLKLGEDVDIDDAKPAPDTAATEALQRKLTAAEAVIESHKREKAVDQLLAESKLPDYARTSAFRTQLMESRDEPGRKALIEDRRMILASQGSRVVSREQVLEDAPNAATSGTEQGKKYVQEQLARRGIK